MADKLTTKTQQDVHNLMFDLIATQRTFMDNHGDALPRIKRSQVHHVTITTAPGLVLGGLIGTIVGMRRRSP